MKLPKETKAEKESKSIPSGTHPHVHIVKYKQADGNIHTYRYTYGLIQRKKVLQKVRER